MKKLHLINPSKINLGVAEKEVLRGQVLILGEDLKTIITSGQTEKEVKENLTIILKRISEINKRQKMFIVFVPVNGN